MKYLYVRDDNCFYGSLETILEKVKNYWENSLDIYTISEYVRIYPLDEDNNDKDVYKMKALPASTIMELLNPSDPRPISSVYLYKIPSGLSVNPNNLIFKHVNSQVVEIKNIK